MPLVIYFCVFGSNVQNYVIKQRLLELQIRYDTKTQRQSKERFLSGSYTSEFKVLPSSRSRSISKKKRIDLAPFVRSTRPHRHTNIYN